MIKKITSIKNMATFVDFNWDNSLGTDNGHPTEFSNINIFYGRNYSGKTTVSRIIRSLETGVISTNYINPEYTIEATDIPPITHTAPDAHNLIVRVFNSDFIRENLKFFYNPDESINSFAIGRDNAEIESSIELKQIELGSLEKNDGLYTEFSIKVAELNSCTKVLSKAESDLKAKLDAKATDRKSGIKYSPYQYDQNYNIAKLENDIQLVIKPSYKELDFETLNSYRAHLKEEAKSKFPLTENLSLVYDSLNKLTKELVEKQISIASPIQDLINDSLLENWVRTGIPLHKHKKNNCSFCGNILPANIWEKLENHFNIESEALREDIENLLKKVTDESESELFENIDLNKFYSIYHSELQILEEQISLAKHEYQSALDALKTQLTNRLQTISKAIIFIDFDFVYDFTKLNTEYQEIKDKSNLYTNSLEANQKLARQMLRLNEVSVFLKDINYLDEIVNIEFARSSKASALKDFQESQEKIRKLGKEIESLKLQLKDEAIAAELVNHYLNDFFGHEFLSLKSNGDPVGPRFEVIRNDIKAHHLSEGECSLIAFCYFMAKLKDVLTKDKKPLIWIDDPISSLDGNHIFFVFSLIVSQIVKSDNFSQLFISTHNLDFLKYLKKISNNPVHQRAYFIFQRTHSSSYLKRMPKYLKNYVTEFNYLFEEMYKCASAELQGDEVHHDSFYNFGNNARKFLEAYLFYKYPNANKNDDLKLEKFFGNLNSQILADRINNEYSHLQEIFDRSMTPIEVPEMKKVASYILQKINEKDPDQFHALCESIDKNSVDVLGQIQ